MKRKRITVKGLGIYHVFNRTAYARYTLDDVEREMFVAMMRKQAAFCGIEILSYCVLSNHYHMLIRVPEICAVDDRTLIARYRCLYSDDPPPKTALRPRDLEALLAEGKEPGERIRTQLHSRMHRLSIFMKELQQRFGIWYNVSHGNKGTLWSERFRSVLVQNSPRVMRIVAAYIELNPVRAGIVKRPEAFRWCSLSAALAGDADAQCGIRIVTGFRTHYQRALTMYLHQIHEAIDGSRMTNCAFGSADADTESQAICRKTNVPLGRRIGAFTRGAILGTAAFVGRFQQHSQDRGVMQRKRWLGPFQVPGLSGSSIFSLRRSRPIDE